MYRSLLFVSDVSPNNRLASSVIFYRHLCRLEDDGWRVHLVLQEGDIKNYAGRESWRVKVLPMRRRWYPPFRPYGLLAAVRYSILGNEVRQFVKESQANVILGYLRGVYFSGFAAYLSARYTIPLGYFYHDATELFPDMAESSLPKRRFTRFKARLIEQASIVWAVSPAMTKETQPATKARLLFPMPEDIPVLPARRWNASIGDAPLVVHAGTVYNETVESLAHVAQALAPLNGRLLLFTNSTDAASQVVAAAAGNVEVQPAQPVAAVCREVHERAAAMLIAYPSDAKVMPWIRSNFPSKFVQFTGVGVPTWILAPVESEIGRWAAERKYRGQAATYDPAGLTEFFRMLTAEPVWNELATECGRWWVEEFHPDIIQAQLEKELDQLAERARSPHSR